MQDSNPSPRGWLPTGGFSARLLCIPSARQGPSRAWRHSDDGGGSSQALERPRLLTTAVGWSSVSHRVPEKWVRHAARHSKSRDGRKRNRLTGPVPGAAPIWAQSWLGSFFLPRATTGHLAISGRLQRQGMAPSSSRGLCSVWHRRSIKATRPWALGSAVLSPCNIESQTLVSDLTLPHWRRGFAPPPPCSPR